MAKIICTGWKRKAAFDGIIDGRHIQSPAKIEFYLVQEDDDPEVHGRSVSTLKVPVDQARAMNGGADDYYNFIGAEVQPVFSFVNGRSRFQKFLIVSKEGKVLDPSTVGK